jgi:putative lipoprotein
MRSLVLVLSLWSPAGPGRGDSWLSTDKVKHFFVSAFVQSVSYSALRSMRASHESSLVGASAVTLAAGVGKEVHDERAGEIFSVRDLVWDVAGAGAATVLLSRTR